MDIEQFIRDQRLRAGSGYGLLLVYALLVGAMILTGMAIT